MLWMLLVGSLALAEPTVDQQVQTKLVERVADLRVEQLEIEVTLKAWEAQLADGKTLEVAMALRRPSLDDLLTQRSSAAVELLDLSQRYGERHPELLAARAGLEAIGTHLREEVQRVLLSERVRLEVLQATEQALLAATP